jgi:protocatechuate 3,4-dioxygenase beta subunit
MTPSIPHLWLRRTRRGFLSRLGGLAALTAVPGLYAGLLTRTPAQTEGPFYPDHLPLDTDNDLLVVNDGLTPAAGVVTWLSGRILGAGGEPIRNALVEIWQADQGGAYLHSGSDNGEKRDRNFQGFGRFRTGSSGEYLFRTIRPVAYPGRTPHIHYKVKYPGREAFTTQCYVEGDPGNAADGVLKEIKDPAARKSVIIPFRPLPKSRVGELAARFDVVLGYTPEA